MRVLKGLSANILPASVLTIGNFDGVHLGHQTLLANLKQKAHQLGLPLVVMTFCPSPKRYFSSDKNAFSISSFSDKCLNLGQYGVDYVCAIRFNRTFSQIEAKDFIQALKIALNPRFLQIGHDFRFGHQRAGDVGLLKAFLQESCELSVLPAIKKSEKRISSTDIRGYLNAGDLQAVNQLLGRPYTILGKVSHGQQWARTIGVPTANILLNHQKTPLTGIFCVEVKLVDSHKALIGVASLGYRPMVDGKNYSCEVHLFDFNANLYQKRLQVRFLKKLREEEHFASMSILREYIYRDIEAAKSYFKNERLLDQHNMLEN